jgi:simple sugar transport system permease protein
MDIVYVILQSMFVAMTPLLVVALGGLFSERSGIVNIALEG